MLITQDAAIRGVFLMKDEKVYFVRKNNHTFDICVYAMYTVSDY